MLPTRLALCAAALLTAAPVSAATINITFRDEADGGLSADGGFVDIGVDAANFDGPTASAGRFAMESDSQDFAEFVAFCVQIGQFLEDGQPYARNAALFTLGTLSNLDRLFDTAYDSIVDRATSAAFQLVTWEIVEDAGGAIDLTAGAFSLTDPNGTVETIAQGFVDGMAGPAQSDYDLILLESTTSQNIVTARRAPAPTTPSPVPVPATALLLIGGLGGLGGVSALRRTRKG